MGVADGIELRSCPPLTWATYGAQTGRPGPVYCGRSSSNHPIREPMLHASRHPVPPRPLRAHPVSRRGSADRGRLPGVPLCGRGE